MGKFTSDPKISKKFKLSILMSLGISSMYISHKYMCQNYPDKVRSIYFDKLVGNNDNIGQTDIVILLFI